MRQRLNRAFLSPKDLIRAFFRNAVFEGVGWIIIMRKAGRLGVEKKYAFKGGEKVFERLRCRQFSNSLRGFPNE